MSGAGADPRSVPLLQGRRLVSGGGRYVDDLPAEAALHAAFVRSPHPHAGIRSVDPAAARALPGVRGIYVLSDLERMGAGRIPVGWAWPGQHGAEIELLARERVRFAGDPVAVVVADDAYLAEDAAWAVEVDYEPLPAVAEAEAALAPGAPLLHPDWGENVLARTVVAGGDPDAAFAAAAYVVGDRFHVGRAAGMPMETRGAVAHVDASSGGLVLRASTQSAHHVRQSLSETLGLPEGSIRVIPADVGGSFGVKDHLSREEAVVAVLARALGRPVRWIEDRAEHLAAAAHSREQVYDVELAADADGRALALRGRLLLDSGAYSGNHGIGTAIYAATMLPGPYALTHYRLEVLGVVTNKAPSAAYRGYGAPESAFVVEGLMERLARAAGLDPAEARRRNLVRPEAFPYTSAAGLVYDAGDYPRVLERALELAGYAERRRHPAAGRGVGVAFVVQRGGFGPSRPAAEAGMRFGGFETALVRMDATGKASVYTGISTQGQGVDTALAQIAAGQLGLDPERDVTVVSGDTALTPFSPVGAIASRGAAVGGGAVHRAAGAIAEKLRGAAAILLEAAAADVELRDGRASVRGSSERFLPIAEVASALRRGGAVPEGSDPSLEALATFEPANETTSYAAHVAEVAVDAGTGKVRVERYVTVTDCGSLVNPAVVEGQVAGAVVQGIGGALTEELAYAEDGTFLAPTLAEYHLPAAADVPAVEVELLETASPETPHGARGAGEIGIAGPAAAIAAAVADALGPACPFATRIPLTPERVWKLARATRSP